MFCAIPIFWRRLWHEVAPLDDHHFDGFPTVALFKEVPKILNAVEAVRFHKIPHQTRVESKIPLRFVNCNVAEIEFYRRNAFYHSFAKLPALLGAKSRVKREFVSRLYICPLRRSAADSLPLIARQNFVDKNRKINVHFAPRFPVRRRSLRATRANLAPLLSLLQGSSHHCLYGTTNQYIVHLNLNDQ